MQDRTNHRFGPGFLPFPAIFPVVTSATHLNTSRVWLLSGDVSLKNGTTRDRLALRRDAPVPLALSATPPTKPPARVSAVVCFFRNFSSGFIPAGMAGGGRGGGRGRLGAGGGGRASGGWWCRGWRWRAGGLLHPIPAPSVGESRCGQV